MPRYRIALLLGVLLLGTATPQEETPAEPPPVGNWKLLLPLLKGGGQNPIWLLQITKKGEAYEGKVLANATKWPKGTLKDLSVMNDRLRFTLELGKQTIPCNLKITEAKDGRLMGLAQLNRSATPVELIRTRLTSLSEMDLLRDELTTKPLGSETVEIAMSLLSRARGENAKPAEVRAWAEKAVRSAELYGPEFARDILLAVAGILSEEKEFAAIALQYARRAERGLDAKEPPTAQKRVLEILATALERAGKADEAKETLARLKKLDFRIKPRPYAGRTAKSDRAVLVELFTGAQCPPCVAADLAFDALGKTYQDTEVVLLQYHVHVPGPDALACPESEGRFNFYEEAEGTPAIFFNGKQAASGGGGAEEALEKYNEYLEVINPLLERPAEAKLALRATRKGDKLTIEAAVSELAKPSEDLRLRVALVEKEVAYKGRNGLPVHHQVVRHMPGGEAGRAIAGKEGKFPLEVDLAAIKKNLNDYLDKVNEKRPFETKDRPMELKNLRVVAFVQNDKTNEVLQAVVVDVKAEE
ncbi:MAG: hypothetical protein SNJ82_00545 [Gemmataceae bacterium]